MSRSDWMTSRGLAKRSLVVFAIKAASAAAVLLMHLMLARRLGAGPAGVFFLGLSSLAILSSVTRVGLDNTVVRFAAEFLGHDQAGKLRTFLVTTTVVVAAISGVLAFALVLGGDFLADVVFREPRLAIAFPWFALALPFLSLQIINARFIQGLGLAEIAMFSLNGIIAAAMIAILAVMPDSSLEAVLGAYVLSVTVSWGLGTALLLYAIRPFGGFESIDRAAIIASCRPLFVVLVFNQVVLWSPQLFLGVWSTSETVGIFTIALRIATLVSFLLIAVNGIVAPQFATLFSQGRLEALERLVHRASGLLLGSAFLTCSIVVLFRQELLSLFGQAFTGGSTALMILAAGQFVNVATGSVNQLLIMTGQERQLRRNTLAAGVLAIGLSLALVPNFSLIGAACATSAGIIIKNLLGVRSVRQRLGIKVMAFGSRRP